MLVILSGVSGAGKDTIKKELIKRMENVISLPSYTSRKPRNGEKEGFESLEAYKELTAVKEGNVYEIDNNLIDRQGYRNAEGLLTLAKIFHPEAFEQ